MAADSRPAMTDANRGLAPVTATPSEDPSSAPDPLPSPGWRSAIPAVVLAVMAARCLAAMLIPALRTPGPLDGVVLIVAAVSAVILAATGPVSRLRWAAAAAAVAFWLTPVLSAMIHGQQPPVAAAAMAAVAVALIVGPPRSGAAVRVAVVVGLLVVVLSLGFGLLSATGIADGAFHSWGSYQRSVFGIPALKGIALHPNTLGQIAGTTLLIALAVATIGRPRWWFWILPALTVLTLLWTESRSSIGATTAAVAALFVVRRWPRLRPWIVAGACVAVIAPPLVLATVGSVVDLSGLVTGRQWPWFVAGTLFAESPLTGYGPDAFGEVFWQQATLGPPPWEALHAHNEALEAAAQAGLIGLVTLAAVMAAALVPALKRSGRSGSLTVALMVMFGLLAGFEVVLGLTYFPASYLTPAVLVAVFSCSRLPRLPGVPHYSSSVDVGAPNPPGRVISGEGN